MKKLRLVHLYLGSLFGPLLIIFAISGAWQVFRFNDAKKDGTYKPAKIITLFTDIHKDAVLPGVLRRQGAAMRWFVLCAAAGLASTTVLGIVMAYRLSRRPALVTTLLIAGVVLPAALLFLAR
jgi:ABC-type spermidine/putrescine transport system permease subunit I